MNINPSKKYQLNKTDSYRIEGSYQTKFDNALESKTFQGHFNDMYKSLRVTSMMKEIEVDTVVIVDKLLVNEYHPDIVRAFVPSLDAYITAISFFDLKNCVDT